MIWITISNEERLHLWKKHRESIRGLDLNAQLTEIAKFCFDMPFGSRTLDYYTPEDWPTPWEILFNDSFCTSSISLLMVYTLILLDATADVELLLVEDADGIYLLPIIQDQFVLNFELGMVNNYSEIQDKLKVLQRYTKDKIKKIK